VVSCRMKLKFALTISLLCGAVMPYAFSPYHWLFLAVIGLGGWLFITMQRPEHAFKLGWAFGFGWFGGGAWWLADTFHIYGHIHYALALVAVALIGIVLGSVFGLWAWIFAKLLRNNIDALWLFPVVGTFIEWLRSFLFTGLPWTAIGNLIIETPASSWLSVLGSYGSTFIILLFISSAALLLQKETQMETRKFAVIGIVIGLGAFLFSPQITVPENPSHTAALIQPNIPQDQKWNASFLQTTMNRLAQLSAQAGNVDLIVWPEASVPFYLSRSPSWNTWLVEHMNGWNTPVIFGAIERINKSSGKSQNGLFLHQTNQEERQFVGKHHLVPFGEYVPSWVPWLGKLVPDIGDFEAAQDNGLLTFGNQHFGSIICYESIFPDETKDRIKAGADVLIVVTNDAWYDHSPAAWQHLQASQARAIESGRYILRATNTGISAIISPDGKVQETMPWWQEGFVKGKYQPLTHITLYQQWGDKPILFIVFLGLGFGLFRIYRGRA